MCLTSSKQIHAFLRPLIEANMQGLSYSELKTQMLALSQDQFSENLVNAPARFRTLFADSQEDGEISYDDDLDRVTITERGKKSYWFIYHKDIAPTMAALPAE